MEEKSERLRVYKVNTPLGPRNLTFVQEKREENSVVCSFCPYYNVCNRLPHPETPDNKDKSFMDFCYNVTSDLEKGPSVGDFIPKAGTIEENIADIADPYKALAQDKHAYVKLSDVIDNVCADICPDFDPSHCNCGLENKFCILRQLYRNPGAKENNSEENGE